MPKSSCAHLERQLDFSLSGVLSVSITHRHKDTRVILPRFGENCCFYELYKQSFNKNPTATGKKEGVRLSRGWKGMCLNSIFIKKNLLFLFGQAF